MSGRRRGPSPPNPERACHRSGGRRPPGRRAPDALALTGAPQLGRPIALGAVPIVLQLPELLARVVPGGVVLLAVQGCGAADTMVLACIFPPSKTAPTNST